MILKNIGMLVAPSVRTKAYVQTLVKSGYLPGIVLIMSREDSFRDDFNATSKFGFGDMFDPFESLLETLKKNNIPFRFCGSKDPNSAEVIKELMARDEEYFVYSGPASVILTKAVLSSAGKFIHIHSGWLPKYKGSTTVYYSILDEGSSGVTAFFMNEEIDSGEIIRRKTFENPGPGMDIDYYYDCAIRAALLGEIIEVYTKTGTFPSEKNMQDKNEPYYIIHPVLKHLAIMNCQSEDLIIRGKEKVSSGGTK